MPSNSKGHTSNVYAVAVLPSGQVVSGSRDKTLKVWESPSLALTQEQQQVLQAIVHNTSLTLLSLSNVVLNEIPNAMSYLKEILQKHPSLTTLISMSTGLTDVLLEELLPILFQTHRIKNLVLEGNLLSESTLLRVKGYCHGSSFLTPSKATSVRVPKDYYCPITHQIMLDPVIVTVSGHTYEREAIEQCLQSNDIGTDPLTREKFKRKHLKPNITLKKAILGSRKKNLDLMGW